MSAPQATAPATGPNDLLAHGLRMHQAGKLDVAAELYQRVLETEPEQPYALHLLGEILLRRKEHARALDLISRAVARLTDHPEAHNNLGAVLQALGRSDEAERAYRRAIELNPALAIAHSNLGTLLLGLGRGTEAEHEFQLALAQAPALAEAHLNLGNLYRQAGDHASAEASYRRAIAAAPRNASAYVNLGLALVGQNKKDAALDSYLKAAAFDPNLPEIQLNIGKLHTDQGDHRAAEACYRRAVALAPDTAEAHNSLGLCLFTQRRYAEATAALRRASEIRPDFVEAVNGLGAALRNTEQLHEAVLCFDRVIELRPDHASAYNNRGLTLVEMGLVPEGIESIKAAMRLKANFHRAHSNLLLCSNYLPDITPAQLRAVHESFDPVFRRGRGPDEPLAPREADPGRRLRVGYISPDFKRHSCAFFIEKILAHHNKSAVEIYCYADVPAPDAVTARLKSHADHWRDVTPLDLAGFRAQVTEDRIDILVDLAGHTAENRLHALVDRLAPVQVNWLGYPATTGLAAMDYRLTDARVDPPGDSDRHGVETLVRLPDTFLCYQPPAEAPEIVPAPNTKGAAFTFGSFNNIPKVSRAVVAAWARILREAPGTRLILKSRSFVEETTRGRIAGEFAAEGIAAGRLELIGWLNKPSDHLRLYERIDLALDPFPYNGTTTTCEALWMGVPVLTLAGERHAARVGASLLGGLGLDEYVVPTVDAYVARAVALAQEPAALNALRTELRTRMTKSALCDGPRFARALETAYRQMWRRWCSGAQR